MLLVGKPKQFTKVDYMICLKRQKYRIDSYYIDVIKERMVTETCKTNLNSQLIFRQSYTGYTFKAFVGNWSESGFWISKYRLQLIQLRPDIIAKFRFKDLSENSIVSIRYSIGFSSVFIGLIWIFLFSAPFVAFGLIVYLIGLALMIVFYSVLSVIELNSIKEKIVEKLFHNIPIVAVD
jgi:hypothetical protein